jgi:WD40 repeat protein
MGSAVNVDGTAGTDFTPTGSGQDLLFVKYSATGALLDGVSFNGTSGSSVSSMSLSPDGGVVASGGFSGTLFLPLSSSAAVGSFDAFLLKFDSSDGDFLWGRKHGGANVDGFGGLTTLGCGDILTTGSYRSTGVDFGGGALPYSGSGSTIGNGVLAKYRP